MTDTLYRLTEDGRRLIGEAFLRGDTELSLGNPDDSEYLEPIRDPDATNANLDALDAKVDTVLAEYPRFDTGIDGALAADVHRHLDLTPRVAGDPGLWHWLAVDRYPELVRHRWEYRTEKAMREKFLGAGSDLYSNAIHRLWWIAELTHVGDGTTDDDREPYSLTERVFGNQTLINRVFDRWFARYRPAVVAICDELADEPSPVIDETTRRFNHMLTNIQLEGLTEEDTRRIIREIIDEIETYE